MFLEQLLVLTGFSHLAEGGVEFVDQGLFLGFFAKGDVSVIDGHGRLYHSYHGVVAGFHDQLGAYLGGDDAIETALRQFFEISEVGVDRDGFELVRCPCLVEGIAVGPAMEDAHGLAGQAAYVAELEWVGRIDEDHEPFSVDRLGVVVDKLACFGHEEAADGGFPLVAEVQGAFPRDGSACHRQSHPFERLANYGRVQPTSGAPVLVHVRRVVSVEQYRVFGIGAVCGHWHQQCHEGTQDDSEHFDPMSFSDYVGLCRRRSALPPNALQPSSCLSPDQPSAGHPVWRRPA